MSVVALHDRLRAHPPRRGAPALLCITGASGAGKTAALATLRQRIEPRLLPLLHFDSLGVPSDEEMELGWESGRAWQKSMTWHWVRTAITVYRTRPLVFFEGSFDPQYALAACTANGLRFKIVVLDADATTRKERLARRDEPHLATDDMTTWANYLRETTLQYGGVLVDASSELDAVVDALCVHALELIA
jgi:hypothetical protein